MTTPDGIIREAFTIRLKPGALPEWRAHHDNVWPDLLAEQARCGFQAMCVYDLGDNELLVVSEVDRADAWDELIDLPVHKKWVEYLSALSDSALPDNTVRRGNLAKVLELTF